MKRARRFVSIILAVLMILSSVAVLGSAWDAQTEGGTNLNLSVKVFRQVNGQWIETNKVAEGEDVKLRAYIDTDYYTPSGTFAVFYNSSFFTGSGDAVLNSVYSGKAYVCETATTIGKTSKLTTDSTILSSNNYFLVTYYNTEGKSYVFDGEDWFCEFDLTVKDDAQEVTGKEVFFPEESFMSPAHQTRFGSIDKCLPGKEFNASSMAIWEPSTSFAGDADVGIFANPVTVTFDANGGAFVAEDTDYYVAEGDSGDAFDGVLPEINKTGSVLTGWTCDDGDTVIDFSDITTYPMEHTVYVAVWESDAGSNAGRTVTLMTKFFREEDGSWVPVDHVAPGDQVKARVYVATDYPTRSGSIVFFYDNDFFTDSYTGENDLVMNTQGDADDYGITGKFIGENSTSNIERSLKSVLDQDYLDSHNFLAVNFLFDDDQGNAVLSYDSDDDDSWLFEFDLTVKADAPAEPEDGALDVFEDTFVKYGTTGLYGNIGRGKAGETSTVSMYNWDEDRVVVTEINPVTTGSKIILNANTGAFDGQAEDEFTVSGIVDDPADYSNVPDLEKEGYACVGWSTDPDATAADKEDLPETIPAEEVTYYAIWVEQVEITFDYGFDSLTDSVTVTAGDPFEKPGTPTREGYSSAGWTPAIPEVYPDADTTYTLSWEAKTYRVYYKVLNSYIPAVVNNNFAEVQYGEEVSFTVPGYTAPEGYTLSGPYTDETYGTVYAAAFDMPANNITLYYKLVKGQFDADFYLDENATEAYLTETVDFDAPIPVPTDPTKDGYEFKGWDPADLGVMDNVDGKSFVGTWEALPFTATYMVDSDEYEVTTNLCDDEIDVPVDPVKDGYEFIGWSDDEESKDVVDFSTMVQPAEDIIFYAVFEPVDSSITFDANGGEFDIEAEDKTSITIEGKADSTYTVPADPEQEGYDFAGWLDADDNPVEPDGVMPAEDTTLHADWTKATFTVTYIVNGEVWFTDDAEYEAEVPKPTEDPDDAVEGYTFTGWTPASDAALTEMPARDLELIAAFEVNEYEISFDPAGGEIGGSTDVYTDNIDYGEDITKPTATKEGYDFAGWAEKTAGKTDYTFSDIVTVPATMPAEDLSYIAVWAPTGETPYTIETYTMNTAGEYELTDSIDNYGNAGATAVATANPVTGFYLDDGSENADYTSVTSATIAADGSTVLKLFYARESYTITFKLNNGTINGSGEDISNDYYYEATVTVPADPTRTNYVFSGWSPAVVTKAVADAEYEAQWSLDTATASFWLDDAMSDLWEAKELEIGDDITAPAHEPSKDYYTFEGWSDDGTTVLTNLGQITADGADFIAVFTPNSYKLITEANDPDPSDGNVAKFPSNANTVNEEDVEYGSVIPAPEEPIKSGYEFNGWVDENDNPVTFTADGPVMTEDGLTLRATWTPEDTTYTVNVWKMGTDGNYPATADSSDIDASVGEEVDAGVVPEEGFYIDEALSTTSGKVIDGGYLTLDVYLARNQHTVTVYVDGVVTETDHYYGEEVSVDDPSKDGYEFTEWVDKAGDTVYTNVDTEDAYTFDMPDEDVTLIAQWNVGEFKVVYIGNGGTLGTLTRVTKNFNYNQIITDVPEFTREGYTFTGWVDADSNPAEVPVLMPAEDLEFTAQWDINSYNVIFDAGEGEFTNGDSTDTETGDYNTPVTAPDDPTRDGYTFGGWVDENNEPVDTDNAVFTADTTYTAVWNAAEVVYKVFLHYTDVINDIEVSNEYKETADGYKAPTGTAVKATATASEAGTYDAVIPETNPSDNHYEFNAADSRNVLTGTVAEDGSLVLDAYYSPKTYSAYFNSNGGKFLDSMTSKSSGPLPYNALIPELKAVPVREGYTFGGWQGYTAWTTRITGEIQNFKAIWNPNPNTLTFDAGEGATFPTSGNRTISSEVLPDEAVTAPEEPEKPGYTFEGWSSDGGTTVIGDTDTFPAMGNTPVTYVAQWSANEHTVTYYEEDGTAVFFGPENADYGDDIPVPTADYVPADDAYEFVRWETKDEGTPLASFGGKMPDKDLEFVPKLNLKGQQVVLGYKVEYYYMNTDGTWPTNPTFTATYGNGVAGEEISLANITDPEGYTLDTTKSVLTGVLDETKDLVLKVYFARNQYTITITVEGTDTDYEFYVDQAVSIADPVVDGKVFTGYVLTSDGTTEATIPAVMPAENMALTAVFEDAPNKVTFDAGEGKFPTDGKSKEEYDVKPGNDITVPENPERDKYDFAGWTDGTNTYQPDEIPQMGDTPVTYTAVWEIKKFTVTYKDYNDGPARSGAALVTVGTPTEVSVDTEITLPAAPVHNTDTFKVDQYYTFKGWDYNGTIYAPGAVITMPEEDIEIVATYERVKVMLIPKNDEASTVIDRDGGTVDDYVAGTSDWLVYGIDCFDKYSTTVNLEVLMSSYIDVQGEGTITVTPVEDFGYGTGALITVTDSVTGEVVETFHIVIFGDLNGDGDITSDDLAICRDEEKWKTSWSVEGTEDYSKYVFMAANLSKSSSGSFEYINASDTTAIRDAILFGNASVDQTEGFVNY